MARTIKVNDTQLVMLSTAAACDDHMALPLPDSVGQDDPETGKAITSLLRRKLLEEVDVPANAPARRSGEGRRLGLKVTGKALDAIGIKADINEETTAPQAEQARAFIAPDLAKAIIEGRQPVELSVNRLKQSRPLPMAWDEQRRVLGFPAKQA